MTLLGVDSPHHSETLATGGRSSARSARISLPALTHDAAERAVAALWCRLEQHGLATPKLGVRAGDKRTLKLSLEFEGTLRGVIAIHQWAAEMERRFATRMPHLRLLLDERQASRNRASDAVNAP